MSTIINQISRVPATQISPRFLFFVVRLQFSQDMSGPENQILIPDWAYFSCTAQIAGQPIIRQE